MLNLSDNWKKTTYHLAAVCSRPAGCHAATPRLTAPRCTVTSSRAAFSSPDDDAVLPGSSYCRLGELLCNAQAPVSPCTPSFHSDFGFRWGSEFFGSRKTSCSKSWGFPWSTPLGWMRRSLDARGDRCGDWGPCGGGGRRRSCSASSSGVPHAACDARTEFAVVTSPFRCCCAACFLPVMRLGWRGGGSSRPSGIPRRCGVAAGRRTLARRSW